MEKPLQWHPAFQAVLQIEFAEEAEHLQFLKEYNLTDSPLRIDTLIVKKEKGVKLRKKIGRIFCILRSRADSDAFQSGRYAEYNGRPKTLNKIA